MSALGVLHVYEVPVELRVTVQSLYLIYGLLRKRFTLYRCGKLLVDLHKLGADLLLALGGVVLDGLYLSRKIRVAHLAGGLYKILVVQRTGKIMVGVRVALFVVGYAHVAVRAGVHSLVFAAVSVVGLELRMLDLYHLHTGVRVLEIVATGAVVVSQNGVRSRFRDALVRRLGSLGGRIEIVFDVALRAANGGRGDLLSFYVRIHGIRHVIVGYHYGAWRVAVAVIAAYRLADGSVYRIEVRAVDRSSQGVDHGRHVRGLAGKAVGQFVRTGGLRHILKGIVVPYRLRIIVRKSVAAVERLYVRIGLRVFYADSAVSGVPRVVHVALVDVGIIRGPFSRAYNAVGAFRFDVRDLRDRDLGDLRDLFTFQTGKPYLISEARDDKQNSDRPDEPH